jgi:hypothetical protein
MSTINEIFFHFRTKSQMFSNNSGRGVAAVEILVKYKNLKTFNLSGFGFSHFLKLKTTNQR